MSSAAQSNRWLGRNANIRPEERWLLFWCWALIFFLFLSYYILRPIRDELGVAGGVRNLPWLFTGTLLAMVAVNPLFSYVVKKWPREKFIPIVYRFFAANLLLFMVALNIATLDQQVWIGRIFFIWVSVFNLFVVSVFWSFAVDVFNKEQGKRLFGFLAAGATTGGMAGSFLTSRLVEEVGPNWLMLVSIVLIELAVFSSNRLSREVRKQRIEHSIRAVEPEGSIDGGLFSGMWHTFRSPYLLGISLFMLVYSVTSTFLYFYQASIAETAFTDRAARTAFFANIDFWVNTLTLIFQLLLTARIMRWVGVGATLCALPLVSILGFASLASYPAIGAFVAVQVLRRVSNFAFAKPAREVLFTLIPREDRYKAKNFIDTVVYRAGDQIGSWSYAGLMALGLSLTGIAVLAVPISIGWLMISFWLGKKQTAISAVYASRDT